MTWKELKDLLASGRHHYDPELLEKSPLGLKRYAAIARDYRLHNGGMFAGSWRTRDTVSGTAITFRMAAGFPGAVNRSHPASIEPVLIDSSSPPLYYGEAVLLDGTSQGVRPFGTGDSAVTTIYGVTVRPFPLQQNTTTPSLYTATPPTSGLMDVLRSGYIMIQFNNSGSAPVKGGQPYVWYGATSSPHTQGLWETASGASTATVGTQERQTYQGGWDANNTGELAWE